MTNTRYVIATGRQGRDRLRVIARIFTPSTSRLLDEIDIAAGMGCLDAGCGGGDVSADLGRRVGPTGRVLGIDLDAVALDIAKQEEAEQNLGNVEYRELDVLDLQENARFDIAYARFLLSHLPDPDAALARMVRSLRPGGMIAVEDIEFSGHFCAPECPAFREYIRLYSEVVRAKGADPDIGPRLPLMLREAGLREVAMNVVQPAGTEGDMKLISPITMENISDAVASSGLASPQDLRRIVEDLYAEARDNRTVLSTPRIVQAWARKH